MKQVYNSIAVRDNKMNCELAVSSHAIAAATKMDSNAMKSISVITMLFLPGTFVSVRRFLVHCRVFMKDEADAQVRQYLLPLL